MAEALAEALRLRQEAKLAAAKAASESPPRPAPRPARPKQRVDPEAERARLIAQGEKILKRQEDQQAREAARVEADLAKRQAQRQRDADRQERERIRDQKEQERARQQQRLAALKQDAEQRTIEVQQRSEALGDVLRLRLGNLHRWHPRVEQALQQQGPEGLAAVVEDVQQRSPLPDGCRGHVEAGYAPEARQVVVNMDLPGLQVMPTVAGYRFIVTRAEIAPQPRKDTDIHDQYRTLVARLALRALDEVFAMTPAALVDNIVLNGFVAAIDPTTGQSVHPCVISVVAERADVEALVLDEPALDAQRCLRAIGAEISNNPHDLEAVPPVVEIDLARYRITADAAAVTGLDSRPDLLTMDPFAFERLVRQLFEAMGYETWRTQGSRDDGIDAVAVKRDSLVATVFAIQAKRTKNHVPVETVRALAGTLHDVNASHGILVSTSWYGKASTDFAHRHGRLHLINGRELKALLREHLGIDALISLPKTPPGWKPTDLS